MEKIWTVPELQKTLGRYYVKPIVAKDVTLTRNQVYDALNGRSDSLELIDRVQAAARLAVADAEVANTRLSSIKAQLTAHKSPTSNAA